MTEIEPPLVFVHRVRCFLFLVVLLSSAFPGGKVNYTSGQTICVKTHTTLVDRIPAYKDGAVLIIRNPYRSLVAEAFRRYANKKNSKDTAAEYFKTSG